MHSQKPDGTIVVLIDLKGTLHDGLIDASGSFRRGRQATLEWRKKPGASITRTPTALTAQSCEPPSTRMVSLVIQRASSVARKAPRG